jgi:hypothetical protein
MSTTSSFDLWMSKGAHNIFSLPVNIFLRQDWVAKHVKFGLFEAYETSRHELAKNFRKLLE